MLHEQFLQKNSSKKLIVCCFVFIIILAVVVYRSYATFLNVSYIYTHIDLIQYYIQHHYYGASLCYVVFYTLSMSLALPGSSFLTMLGGFFFGSLHGFIYALISASVGSLISFTVSRYLLGNLVQARYKHKIAQFNADITQHGVYYLFFIRLFGLMPLSLTSMLAGLTLISTASYFIITMVGIMPTIMLYSYAGKQLLTLNFSSESSVKVIVFFLLRIAAVPLMVKLSHYLKNRPAVGSIAS